MKHPQAPLNLTTLAVSTTTDSKAISVPPVAIEDNSTNVFLSERHSKILKVVAVLIGAIAILTLSFVSYIRLSSGASLFFPGMLLLTGLLVLCIVTYRLAQSSKPKLLQIGSYLMLVSLAFTVFISLFTSPLESGAIPAFYIIIVLVAALLLKPKEIVGWTIAAIVMFTSNYIATTFILTQRSAPLPPVNITLATFTYFIFACLISVTGSSLYYFVASLLRALAKAETQSVNLQTISSDREQKRQVGLEISQNVNSSSLQLAATAQEQSRANSDLAGAVAEVASGMSQINQNALKIVQTTQQIDNAIRDNSVRAGHLSAAAQQAEQASRAGQEAVMQTVTAINQVDQSIINLEQKLQDLNQNAAQVNNIIKLINEIANETHLLALNAAIESAGAGEFGARFGVVASEVKNLSNRTLQAAHDVQLMLGNARQAINDAVGAVQTGATQTRAAVEIASRGGHVVETLNEVVNRTVEQVNETVHQRAKVIVMMENIVGATQEQQYAARQMLSILEQISQSSSHNATVIKQISSEANSLQAVSERLTLTLQA